MTNINATTAAKSHTGRLKRMILAHCQGVKQLFLRLSRRCWSAELRMKANASEKVAMRMT